MDNTKYGEINQHMPIKKKNNGSKKKSKEKKI
jgi:hypothetical protein